jgi:predicted MFS family arabinose efflux permease
LADLKRLAPQIMVGVMGNSGIYLIPLLVGAMVADRGLTDRQAGLVASADLAGYAVMTFVTAMFLIKVNWRRLAVIGVATMVVANIASTFVTSATMFSAVRFLSGMGAGILAAIATVSLGQGEKPDRNYGLLFAASLLFGTAGLWGLPLLLERVGLNGAYILLALLAVLVGLLSKWLPTTGSPLNDAAESASRQRSWALAALVLLSIALFWAQQNALYAYMERIGNASGLSAQFIGFTLGLANLTGFAGASLVAWAGARFGRFLPLVVSTVVQLACLWALSGHVGSSVYLVAIGLVSLAWNIVNPIQIGILAGVDPNGRALALASTVIGVGLAFGPALGALVLRDADYSRVLWLTAALAVLSVLVALPAMRRGDESISRPS